MIEMLNMTMHENYDDVPKHGLLVMMRTLVKMTMMKRRRR